MHFCLFQCQMWRKFNNTHSYGGFSGLKMKLKLLLHLIDAMCSTAIEAFEPRGAQRAASLHRQVSFDVIDSEWCHSVWHSSKANTNSKQHTIKSLSIADQYVTTRSHWLQPVLLSAGPQQTRATSRVCTQVRRHHPINIETFSSVNMVLVSKHLFSSIHAWQSHSCVLEHK